MKRSEKLKSWTQLKDKLPFQQKSFKNEKEWKIEKLDAT